MKWHKWRNFPNAIFQLHIIGIEGCSNQLLVLKQSIRWYKHKQYEMYMLAIIKEIQQAPQLMCYSNIIQWHPNTKVRTVKDLLVVTWAPKSNQLPYGLTWPWPIWALLKLFADHQTDDDEEEITSSLLLKRLLPLGQGHLFPKTCCGNTSN